MVVTWNLLPPLATFADAQAGAIGGCLPLFCVSTRIWKALEESCAPQF